MSSNARLVIYGANSTVKVGKYGLVNIPVGADNVDVVIHGGTYLANTNNGSFIKPRGEGAISIVLNDVNLTDTSDKNYAIDASSYYGEKLSVNVEGGTLLNGGFEIMHSSFHDLAIYDNNKEARDKVVDVIKSKGHAI
jgi:hypothetical protein